MGMERYHVLPVPGVQEHGRVEESEAGGMQEAVAASIPATGSSTVRASAILIPVPKHVEAGEMQGKLSSSQSQETMHPPGLTIVLSSPTIHMPIDISPDPISVHLSSHSSHPLAGLTPPSSAHEALAMAHLERTLVLVRSAVVEAAPFSSITTQVTQPSGKAAHIMSNEWYRAINNDSWYKYKPDQHINGVKLHWENPDIPDYATYLKPELQAGRPMLLGSIGPRQPIYGHNLQAQPFHAAELEHLPKATFDLLSNPLDPHIDRAVATLGDLGVTADVFCLRQLPLKYLDQACQMAYVGHKQDRIQWDQGLLHLAK
jgi:hypothetical protein